MKTVTGVAGLGGTRVSVTLSSGAPLLVDLREWLDAPDCAPLRDPAVFAAVEPAEWGHGIAWPAFDVTIGTETLYRLSREQAGTAWPVAQFNAWMTRNRLSLTAAARALGLTRRTILYYHTGAKPIPRYIELACEGWEHRQARAA